MSVTSFSLLFPAPDPTQLTLGPADPVRESDCFAQPFPFLIPPPRLLQIPLQGRQIAQVDRRRGTAFVAFLRPLQRGDGRRRFQCPVDP